MTGRSKRTRSPGDPPSNQAEGQQSGWGASPAITVPSTRKSNRSGLSKTPHAPAAKKSKRVIRDESDSDFEPSITVPSTSKSTKSRLSKTPHAPAAKKSKRVIRDGSDSDFEPSTASKIPAPDTDDDASELGEPDLSDSDNDCIGSEIELESDDEEVIQDEGDGLVSPGSHTYQRVDFFQNLDIGVEESANPALGSDESFQDYKETVLHVSRVRHQQCIESAAAPKGTKVKVGPRATHTYTKSTHPEAIGEEFMKYVRTEAGRVLGMKGKNGEGPTFRQFKSISRPSFAKLRRCKVLYEKWTKRRNGSIVKYSGICASRRPKIGSLLRFGTYEKILRKGEPNDEQGHHMNVMLEDGAETAIRVVAIYPIDFSRRFQGLFESLNTDRSQTLVLGVVHGTKEGTSFDGWDHVNDQAYLDTASSDRRDAMQHEGAYRLHPMAQIDFGKTSGGSEHGRKKNIRKFGKQWEEQGCVCASCHEKETDGICYMTNKNGKFLSLSKASIVCFPCYDHSLRGQNSEKYVTATNKGKAAQELVWMIKTRANGRARKDKPRREKGTVEDCGFCGLEVSTEMNKAIAKEGKDGNSRRHLEQTTLGKVYKICPLVDEGSSVHTICMGAWRVAVGPANEVIGKGKAGRKVDIDDLVQVQAWLDERHAQAASRGIPGPPPPDDCGLCGTQMKSVVQKFYTVNEDWTESKSKSYAFPPKACPLVPEGAKVHKTCFNTWAEAHAGKARNERGSAVDHDDLEEVQDWVNLFQRGML